MKLKTLIRIAELGYTKSLKFSRVSFIRRKSDGTVPDHVFVLLDFHRAKRLSVAVLVFMMLVLRKNIYLFVIPNKLQYIPFSVSPDGNMMLICGQVELFCTS